jgi:signal transduction histidine kinase
MRLLRLFIQEASHEFRTPLTVIGTSAYLMARTNDAAAIARYVPRINQQVERLKWLLDGMVALTTLESGVPLEHEPIDLPMLMDAVLERAQPLLVNHRLTPDISAQGRIRGDAEWLIAALYELLKNATAYTPPDGAIALRTSVCPVDHVVRIVVEDSGVGIPEEALPYIFNHFWRADSAHTTPGFGLGLSIAGSVTELHGGEIEVESTPGQGSRFAIVLPLLRDQDA